MFGRLVISSPPPSSKVSTGHVNIFREKTDNVRVVLATKSLHDNCAYVATARGSSSTGFSVDIVRANSISPWGDVEVNWFAWSSATDEKAHSSELRGSTKLTDAIQVSDDEFSIKFPKFLLETPKSVVASLRNENRAQVIAVNLLGNPTKEMFTIRLKRLDMSLLETDGTFVDWIVSFPQPIESTKFNRTGLGNRFDSQFPSDSESRIFVISSIINARSNNKMFASSIIHENAAGFSTSKFVALEKTVEEEHSLMEGPRVSYLALEGRVENCEKDCSHQGSCIYTALDSPLPISQCACVQPFSGSTCNDLCPITEDGLVCAGNGYCSQRIPECECFSGWTGYVCADKAYSADSRLVLFVLFFIMAVVVSCLSFWFTKRWKRSRQRKIRISNLRRALIGENEDEDSMTHERYEQIDFVLNGDPSSWAIPYEKLTFGPAIGHGSSSQVYSGLWQSQEVAIKKIAVSRRKRLENDQMDLWLYFKREAGFLSNLHHPNIVRFFGVASQNDSRISTDYFYIVTELCVASLTDVIRRPIITQQVDFAENVLMQISRGMEFLHSKGVVHRDLKCDNILLDTKNVVKLCDFGISRVVDISKGYLPKTTGMVATPAFMAPELITTSSYPCGTKVDVFSFGIVLWSLICWQEPYVQLQTTHSVFDLMRSITIDGLRPSVSDCHWSTSLKAFYSSCVEKDPSKRPTFGEIIAILQILQPDIQSSWKDAKANQNILIT